MLPCRRAACDRSLRGWNDGIGTTTSRKPFRPFFKIMSKQGKDKRKQRRQAWAALAQTTIERYFLPPRDRVMHVLPQPGGALVTTQSEEWRLERAASADGSASNPNYALYHVHLYAATPPRPPGVAVLPDGTLFRLTDEAELKAFWASLGDRLEPGELAWLLAAYQGRGPAFVRRQEIVQRRGDAENRLPDEIWAAVPGMTPLRPVREGDGRLTLDFCTYYLGQEPPEFAFQVGINRWRAEADPQNGLQWSARPLADPRRISQDEAGKLLFGSDEEVFEYLSIFMQCNIADIDLSGLESRDYVQAHRAEQDGRLEAAFHWLAAHEYPPGTMRNFVEQAAEVIAEDDADARSFLADLRSNIFDA